MDDKTTQHQTSENGSVGNFFLVIGMVMSVFGCLGTVAFAIFVARTPEDYHPWEFIAALCAACYSAATFVVFNRVRKK